jgi:transposase
VVEEHLSFQTVATKFGIRSKTQVENWVKKHRLGEPWRKPVVRKGRPKTKFGSVEEEVVYLRAEIDYLKKQYPNLHKE